MRALITLLLASALLAGCSTAPPRCDGSNYRPVNPEKQKVLNVKPWWEQEPYATQAQ